MRKTIAALLAAALLALCLAGAACASDNVKFKSSAYVYDAASGRRTGIIIRKGSVTQYVDQAGGWAQVKVGKQLVWVRASCLMATGDGIKVVYSAIPEDGMLVASVPIP